MCFLCLQVDATTIRVEFDWTVIMEPFQGEGGEMLCVSCTVFAEEKIELSRMLSDMAAKTRRVHGNNN